MDLREYLHIIAVAGELQEIDIEVSSDQEIGAICRREFASAGGGKVLLFKHVTGSSYPVVANIFSSETRVSRLLYADSFAGFAERLHQFMDKRTGSACQRLSCNDNSQIHSSPPQLATTDISLINLPAILSWPKEQNGYLNLALAISESPVDGERNLGLYRGQLIDNHHLALNFSPSSGLAIHLHQAKAKGQKLPVSLILGAEPALIWLASAPLPPSCDELSLYTHLFGKQLDVSPSTTNGIEVPQNYEFVIEGFITPGETVLEGPFGNHTGQYVSRADCPVLRVTNVKARDNAIYPTTVVGTPPSENIFLAQASEILIKQMVMLDYPQVKAIYMPVETIFHGVAFLSLETEKSGVTKELIYNLWDNSPLKKSQLLIFLDGDIDLKSASKCWWRTINRLQTEKVYQSAGRIAIDATGVNPALLLSEDQQVIDLLQRRLVEYEL